MSDLRDQIAAALRTTSVNDGPLAMNPDDPQDHHGPGGHRYYAWCALCQGNVDQLTDALMSVVQAAMAKAWDEGHDAGGHDGAAAACGITTHRSNPYRAEAHRG